MLKTAALTSKEKKAVCRARYFGKTAWGKITSDGVIYSPEAELARERGAKFVPDFTGIYLWPRNDGSENGRYSDGPVSWNIATKARMQMVNVCGFNGDHLFDLYDQALKLDNTYFIQQRFGESPKRRAEK